MKNTLAVKSKSFLVYQAFKSIAEQLGVKWVESFQRFEEKSMNHCTCIYLSEDFKGGGLGMSFSNSSNPEIDLDTNFREAIEALQVFVTPPKEMTLEDIEKELGYRIKLVK